MSSRATSTDKVELVETHNLALALNRLTNAGGYNMYRWKRALYHALAMSDAANSDTLKKIREALELP